MTDKTQQQQADKALNRFSYHLDLFGIFLNIVLALIALALHKEMAMQYHLALAIICRLPPRSVND